MSARRGVGLAGGLAAAAMVAGCVPYTVGSTSHTVAPGESESRLSIYFIPNGIEPEYDSTRGVSLMAMDSELRFGMDERSDIGIRIPGGIGAVVNYKRRYDLTPDAGGPALALMPGAGIVNAGEHAHVELTLLASGRERPTLTPYGGVRVMQVIPLTRDAASDRPTAGVFLGVRIGRVDLGVSPEVGVFYDHSALGLRRRDVIVVPSFTLHGSDLIRALIR